MGKTKDIYLDVQITAQMDDELYNSIPEEYRERFTIKRIESYNYKPEYKKCPIWQGINDDLIEAAKKRAEREAEIRAELK